MSLTYREGIELLSMWCSILRTMIYPEVVVAAEKDITCDLG
jgi:hypothetical protein